MQFSGSKIDLAKFRFWRASAIGEDGYDWETNDGLSWQLGNTNPIGAQQYRSTHRKMGIPAAFRFVVIVAVNDTRDSDLTTVDLVLAFQAGSYSALSVTEVMSKDMRLLH